MLALVNDRSCLFGICVTILPWENDHFLLPLARNREPIALAAPCSNDALFRVALRNRGYFMRILGLSAIRSLFSESKIESLDYICVAVSS